MRLLAKTLCFCLWVIPATAQWMSAQSAEKEKLPQAEPRNDPHPHHDAAGTPAGETGQSVESIAQKGEKRLRLEDLEQMALEGNPTLAQAAANVRAAAGRKLQAGLYPNPTIGVTGDENTPGPIIRGGEFGGFIEQRIVMAGKLGRSRRIFELEEQEAEAMHQAQRLRVLNAVRMLFYEALGAQERVEVQTNLAALADGAAKVSKELANVGAADQPDVLEAELEAERAEIGLSMARTELQRSWRELAAMVGKASLEIAPLDGDLNALPKLELEAVLAKLFSESPEIHTSEAAIARDEAALARAKVEKIPDIVARGGLRYNRELLELGGQPVGLEGFFDVGVEIPIFNRNQGNVATAHANLERTRREADRLKLSLRIRMARAFKTYQDSLNMAQKYGSQMIPRAQKAYDLYLNSFRQMAAAYPQVLVAQRNLFQLQEDYITVLVKGWRSATEIQGLLLSGGLEIPNAMGMEGAGE
jgi:cobalt-zinc-cadmium efflux system outer membrane protein